MKLRNMNNKIFYHYFNGTTDKDKNNYSLQNLQNGKVYFSYIRYFNDPYEAAFYPDESCNYSIVDLPNIEYKYEMQCRVFCFSETFQNPIMWSHYGNSHKGFCVGYDIKDILSIPSIVFDRVTYSDDKPFLSNEDILNGCALFYKSSDWKKEEDGAQFYFCILVKAI